ncbi:hypothetical protein [Marinobacter salicampi]|uniref:hypothetical protein n=1 Tax=Marinobacter salicampi TaxID=435907 RepID=UPI00140D2FC3|nr:hypothetical protein [Marinobacter salicampi]
MKAVVGVVSVVSLLAFSMFVNGSEPVRLEPTTTPIAAKWKSDNFEFLLYAKCQVDFDGLFTKRGCPGASLFVSSSLTFDDQRKSAITNNSNGESKLRSSDIRFEVLGNIVDDWRVGPRVGYSKRSREDLVTSLSNDPKSTVTMTYPVGTIRDVLPPTVVWNSNGTFTETKASNRNAYLTETFQLSGFTEALEDIESAAFRDAQKEMYFINAFLSAIYILLAVLAVVTIRFVSKKAVAGTRKSASKLEESLKERRIQNETKSLHIREEAHRRFEAEKIKKLIQEALEQDDHASAQELMAKLRKAQTE